MTTDDTVWFEPCPTFRPSPEWFDDTCECGYTRDEHETED